MITIKNLFQPISGKLQISPEIGSQTIWFAWVRTLVFLLPAGFHDKSLTVKSTTTISKKHKGLMEGERASIKARVQELKADKANGESAVLAAIAKMPAPYRAIGKQVHALIKASAPALAPKTWYGLPAYARDGKVVCYLRMNPGAPYNDRYMMVGFSEQANLNEGELWPIVFALKELTPAAETRIAALVKKAVR